LVAERPAPEAVEALPMGEAQDTAGPGSAGFAPPAPLCVTQPVRSGQRLYAQGRDLLLLAPTSRGAELIADGSIYAFGLLRGRALAGASGDKTARILATRLDARSSPWRACTARWKRRTSRSSGTARRASHWRSTRKEANVLCSGRFDHSFRGA
jgi:hypothetical protein